MHRYRGSEGTCRTAGTFEKPAAGYTMKHLRRWRWLLIAFIFPFVILISAVFIHPYLSITEPSGSKVAVVEGWIPKEMLPTVQAEILKRGYQKIYTTGTIRPFSYW